MIRLIRVTGKVRGNSRNPFVAGFETNGIVQRAAPLLKFLIGKGDAEVRALIKKNNWRATVVTGNSMQSVYNDLENAPRLEQAAQPSPAKSEVIVDQSCAVCGKLGCFGYGVSIRRGESGTWYCGKHKPDEQREIAA